ncbi:MAG TPA: class I SAM-dependent methyltransferase [Terriglobales bacterium]|nr:class I SAM-dependent methyltransferase [Terriglobales bacterium]
MNDRANPGVLRSVLKWWREARDRDGWIGANRRIIALSLEFLRDSLPSHRRQRFGDVDFDWDHRVDTTAATVNWRDRLLGLLHSPYQPTEPSLFHEMLASLNIDFRQFVFIDVGSGKGRVLLMAADYPFRRVVGVELLPALHRAAEENIGKYKSASQQCFLIETFCQDAGEWVFPLEPLLVYLFNPFPETGLVQLLNHLEQSLQSQPRPVYVLYHNPLLESALVRRSWLFKIGGTHQYSIYRNRLEM